MSFIEIVVIIACVLIVGGVLGNYIYRKTKHLPTGECACCNKGKNLVRMFNEDYPKEKHCSNCK